MDRWDGSRKSFLKQPHNAARFPPAALLALTLASQACRPVFVVGWQEVIFALLLAAFLVGPLLYRLLRAWVRRAAGRNKK